MRTTDKGLQKAIKRQPHYELSSNFSYRMMQKYKKKVSYAKNGRKKECSSSSLFCHTQRGKLHRILYMEIWGILHQLLAHL